MILVTGGAFQGKADFVKARFLCSMIDGESCDFNSVFSAECVCNYHLLIKRLIERGENPIALSFHQLCIPNSPNSEFQRKK